MWKWFFNKFIVKVREQVVADLGLNLPSRSYEEHLDDFLTMLIRMAGTLLAAFVVAFYFAEEIWCLLLWPAREAFNDGRFVLVNGGCIGPIANLPYSDLISPDRLLFAVMFSVPVLLVIRSVTRYWSARPDRTI